MERWVTHPEFPQSTFLSHSCVKALRVSAPRIWHCSQNWQHILEVLICKIRDLCAAGAGTWDVLLSLWLSVPIAAPEPEAGFEPKAGFDRTPGF